MKKAAAGIIAAAAVIGCLRYATAESAAEPEAEPKPVFLVEMETVAAAGSALIDGDACRNIVTDRAEEWLFRTHPKDRWFGSDNYDVNSGPFVRTKKFLIRLSRLLDFPRDCNLWMICKGKPEKVHMVIRQKNGWSQWYSFGQMAIDPPPEMKRCLQQGETVTVTGRKSNYHSVLSPVRDALGDVVGLIEACTRR